MKIGIGLPINVKGVTGAQVTEWARRAEAVGFDSLATMDGLVYPSYEPLVALGAAAAVTSRIELITAIAILPFRRNAALVAKQAATLHSLSGGRLRFGVAVGGAPEDYAVSGVPWSGRGRRLESMLGEIQRVWEHAPRDGGVSVGPDVSGDPPPILLGGAADVTFERAARYGDGWIMAAGPAAAFSEGREKLRAAFRQAGRQTAPLAMAGGFFALGTDAGEVARRNLGEYFVVDPHLGELTLDGTFTTGAELREQLGEFERRGCDHFMLFPASAGAEQVDLLADEVASWLTPTRSAA